MPDPECLWCAETASRLKQLAKARQTRWNKHRGRKHYHKSLGPVNEKRKRIAAMGLGKYDKRRTRRIVGTGG